MAWDVEYTDEFEIWWVGLDEEEQIDIDAAVSLLEEKGLHLPYPYLLAAARPVALVRTIRPIGRKNL